VALTLAGIDVNNSGNYEANLRLAQRGNGAVMSVDVDGQNRTGNISIDSTGNWQSYYTETVSLGNLSSGSHTVRVNFENGGVNFNWVEIEQGGSSSTPVRLGFSSIIRRSKLKTANLMISEAERQIQPMRLIRMIYLMVIIR